MADALLPVFGRMIAVLLLAGCAGGSTAADEPAWVELKRLLVVHLSVANTIVAYHSPLTKEHVSCGICEKGARVRL